MELTSQHPFWLMKNGLIAIYPPLSDDRKCDTVVVGAGISGALVAQRLTELGQSVVVLDRRDVCRGSTAASTALLQYEIDVPLVKLIDRLGRDQAQRAYQLSHQSIDQPSELVQRLHLDCGFARKTSIYLAQDRRAAKLLAEEARARQQIGLDVVYHDQSSLGESFGIPGVAALSSRQAASCDAYQLAHRLLPELDWEIEFAWAGTFGKTKDGLAYIGQSPEYPNCFFALGFGGNGITFSAIAAGLIADMIVGKLPEDAQLFRFGR